MVLCLVNIGSHGWAALPGRPVSTSCRAALSTRVVAVMIGVPREGAAVHPELAPAPQYQGLTLGLHGGGIAAHTITRHPQYICGSL